MKYSCLNNRTCKAWLELRILYSLLIGTMLTLSGCMHAKVVQFTQGTGDAGRFILGHAFARGADPIATNALPAITGPWTYSVDEYGVVIRLPREDYDPVENLLRLSFGKPKIGPTETTDGGKMGMYKMTPRGVILSFSGHSNYTEVIVLRQLRAEEIGTSVGRALKELEKKRQD